MNTVIHPLQADITLPRRFTNPFHYTPHPLTEMAAGILQRYLDSQTRWHGELQRGKMFGVMVVECDGHTGFIAAYSGLLGERNDWPYFVPPIYDSQNPHGYFKQEEAAISRLNGKLALLEQSTERARLTDAVSRMKESHDLHLITYKEKMAEAKRRRDALRPTATPEQLDLMVRESQFMKAELARLRRRQRQEMEELQAGLDKYDRLVREIRQERRKRSDMLQEWLFRQYTVGNARGELSNLLDIFRQSLHRLPPSGAGDCCAPRLLNYAYRHRLKPVCMGEFWWGDSPKGEVRHHLSYYPACRGKCLPILNFMLQGLDVEPNPLEQDRPLAMDIEFEDDDICVVRKPSGLLSVPGLTDRSSVISLLREHWQGTVEPLTVHRLDMDTSGLLVVAKTPEAQRNLQLQFADRKTGKRYLALLDGEWKGDSQGVIRLPLCPDLNDRPRQRVDYQYGKPAVTSFRILSVHDGHTLVSLVPHTGRTHQLRLHCAHTEGLGLPITGDPLYSHRSGSPVSCRLCLHAAFLSFLHPTSGRPMHFEWNDTPGFPVF